MTEPMIQPFCFDSQCGCAEEIETLLSSDMIRHFTKTGSSGINWPYV